MNLGAIYGTVNIYDPIIGTAIQQTLSNVNTVSLTLSDHPQIIELAPNAPTSPVGYWQLNEGTGTTTVDASGNGDTGTLENSPAWVPGWLGDALNFTASSYTGVNLSDASTTGPLKPALPVTVSAWVKLTTTSGNQTIFSSDEFDTSKYAGYVLQINGGVLNAAFGDGTGGNGPTYRRSKQGTTVMTAGQWYHVAVVIQGATNMNLYVNGVDDGGTYTGTGGTMAYTTAVSKIGKGGNSAYVNGIIDDVRVYNYALNSTEVGLLANGPLSNFRFDEASGTTAYDFGTAALTGTLVNSPAWTAGWFSDALNFNGSNTSVSLNDSGSTGPLKPALPVTVSAWIKITANSTNQTVFTSDEFDSTKYYGYVMQINAGVLTGAFGSGGASGPASRCSKVGTTVLIPGQWYHVAMVIQGATNMNLYINGVDDGGTYSGTGGAMVYSNAVSKIGSGGSSWIFNGIIDDVRVYNYALTPTQVETLADPGSGVIAPW